MNGFDRKISELTDERDKLEKEYIEYLEADMNKEAKKINNKMHKIESEILNLMEKQEYGLREDMKKKINQYRKFIDKKGLNYEFDNFIENEDEEEDCL